MRTVDEITIVGDPDVVYRMAADILRWPALFSHYRWVKVIGRHEDGALVEMAARRGWIPVKWTSIQRCCPEKRRIYYRHVGGPTTGMEVVWDITMHGKMVHVSLVHELTLLAPIIRTTLGKLIVGSFFVKAIAQRTLAALKRSIEERGDTVCAEQSSPASGL